MISENIAHIRRRMAAACSRAGRDPEEVTLIGVAKTFRALHIREAVGAGLQDIGENYVQELIGKRSELGDEAIRWHFIGHLQSNKAKLIAGWISLIHSLDSPSLAAELDKLAKKDGRVQDVLVEVNTTGEETKFGVLPDRFIDFMRSLAGFRNIRIAGLMTIGPFLPDPEGSRPVFRQLRELKESASLLDQPNVDMRHLSMGMTGDFEVAIEEGATLVRIGTALFGSRTKHP